MTSFKSVALSGSAQAVMVLVFLFSFRMPALKFFTLGRYRKASPLARVFRAFQKGCSPARVFRASQSTCLEALINRVSPGARPERLYPRGFQRVGQAQCFDLCFLML